MNRIFLLGGMDLEMNTIKEILEDGGYDYLDKHLSWGNALLSAYKDELPNIDKNTMVVGIELREDISVPPRYMKVDHHNEQSDKESSLEQVMRLLNLKMNRYQMLVAANDKGYIDAMKDINATDDEIKAIRREDRKCQGVTDDEEAEAERLVAKCMEIQNRPIMLETKLTHFSPITDRLYPMKEYVISNGNEMVYYGAKKMNCLKTIFAEELSNQKAYYGGLPENHFFGILYEGYQDDEYKQKMFNILSQ